MHIIVAVMCQSINKCPVPLPLRSPFTAVSVYTVSEIYPWGNRAAVLSPWKCAARDKFQHVRGAVSVKEYTGHYHLQIYLACKRPLPPEQDPCWGWARLSHTGELTSMQSLDQTFTVAAIRQFCHAAATMASGPLTTCDQSKPTAPFFSQQYRTLVFIYFIVHNARLWCDCPLSKAA